MSSAPKSETATAPPTVRKKATAEDAAPMSLSPTVFCTASTRFWFSVPTPRPTRQMNTPTSHAGVVWFSCEARNRPVESTMPPTISTRFHRPKRVISCPATMDPRNEPTTCGSMSRPDSVGV